MLQAMKTHPPLNLRFTDLRDYTVEGGIGNVTAVFFCINSTVVISPALPSRRRTAAVKSMELERDVRPRLLRPTLLQIRNGADGCTGGFREGGQ